MQKRVLPHRLIEQTLFPEDLHHPIKELLLLQQPVDICVAKLLSVKKIQLRIGDIRQSVLTNVVGML